MIMKNSYTHMHAKTVSELVKLLTSIVDAGYGDAEWNGWDDGSLCIHPENKDWIAINNA